MRRAAIACGRGEVSILSGRIETSSGMKADEIKPGDMARFVWREKWNLLHFLKWTGELEKTGNRRE